ncbi:methyltransferase domain-containing protein [Candidatus Sumerlaeota bacterium]|nr:methyltransferase domain-containing protein [Candidatus Sumerlaeota bacterium]
MSYLRQTAGRYLSRAGQKIARLGERITAEDSSAEKISAPAAPREPYPAEKQPSILPNPGAPAKRWTLDEYRARLELAPGDFDRVTKIGREAYSELVNQFALLATDQGVTGIEKFAWYHTIDVGGGLITPGYFDYRGVWDRFHFPADMKGMNVLDVGSGTGYFAFEFEKRGAEVVSVDLGSMADWDMPRGEEKEAVLQSLMAHYGVGSAQEVTHCHIEGPFEFCHRRLGSKIKRVHSSIYDLTAEKAGRSSFDMIFVGDLLEHSFSPLGGLSAVAPLCGGTLIISSVYPMRFEDEPVMVYTGGETRRGDGRTWWYPTRRCLEQMLKRLGFREVVEMGYFAGEIHTDIHSGMYKKAIVHAKK